MMVQKNKETLRKISCNFANFAETNSQKQVHLFLSELRRNKCTYFYRKTVKKIDSYFIPKISTL